jgi:hypothetical protein
MGRRGMRSLGCLAPLLVFAIDSQAARIVGTTEPTSECLAVLEVGGVTGIQNSVATCVEGDPCDADGVCGNGSCTIDVHLCVNGR